MNSRSVIIITKCIDSSIILSFGCKVIQCRSPKTSQRPQKSRQGDQLIHRR